MPSRQWWNRPGACPSSRNRQRCVTGRGGRAGGAVVPAVAPPVPVVATAALPTAPDGPAVAPPTWPLAVVAAAAAAVFGAVVALLPPQAASKAAPAAAAKPLNIARRESRRAFVSVVLTINETS